ALLHQNLGLEAADLLLGGTQIRIPRPCVDRAQDRRVHHNDESHPHRGEGQSDRQWPSSPEPPAPAPEPRPGATRGPITGGFAPVRGGPATHRPPRTPAGTRVPGKEHMRLSVSNQPWSPAAAPRQVP